MSWLWVLLACSSPPTAEREVLNPDGATAIPGGESNFDADYGRAVDAIVAGDLDSAERIYAELAAKEPLSGSPWVGLGSVAVMRGDLDAAEMNYQRAVQVEPALLTSHIGLGTVDMERGAYTDALPHYLRALELDSKAPDVHLSLHGAYRELGDIPAAKRHGQEYVDLAPEDANAVWVRAWLAAQT